MTLTTFKKCEISATQRILLESDGVALLSAVNDDRHRLSTTLGQVRRELMPPG